MRHPLQDSKLEGRNPVPSAQHMWEFNTQSISGFTKPSTELWADGERASGRLSGARQTADRTGTAGHLRCSVFKPHRGPRLSPCKVTEKFPSFCRRICFAFWVPVIISDIAPTHPSVLGGPVGESQTDRRRRKVLQGTMTLGKVWTSRLARGLRARCLLPAAPFDESFAKEPGQREL